ncbi:MAG: homoserine kinase [Candidatus Poribacteria bacterium]|nr:homoserine kinase [Candidatus Poribacteria bacterium]
MATSNSAVTAIIPASTTNLGPGFDVLGVAVSLYSQVSLQETAGITEVICLGQDSDKLLSDTSNVAYQAADLIFAKVGYQPDGLRLTLQNGIPAIRGLGGSGTAILGGLLAANAMCGQKFGQPPFSLQEILAFATEIEGHPDNVAASLLGGFVVSATAEVQNVNTVGEIEAVTTVKTVKITPPDELRLIIAVPDFTLATKVARSVLPESVDLSAAVFNMSRSSLLVAAMATGDLDLLPVSMEDRLHQPYRAKLIPGFEEVSRSALEAGALSIALSGAGPTIVAYTRASAPTQQIADQMALAFQQNGLACQTQILTVDTEGAKVN